MDKIKDYTVKQYVKLQLQEASFCMGQTLCSALVGTAQAAPLLLHGKGCQQLNSQSEGYQWGNET